MRFAASQLPVTDPWILTASAAYCEQVGVKRQPADGPNNSVCNGETVHRYTFTSAIKIF